MIVEAMIGGNRQKLHTQLRLVAAPWIESKIEPIIIGWYQYRSAQRSNSTLGMFRIQYGARAWSTGGWPRRAGADQSVPEYVTKFEDMAISLREIKWDALSLHLLPRADRKALDPKKPNIEMFLLIDNQELHFGVRSRETGRESYFLLGADGLQPQTACPKVWFDAWPNQRNLTVFLPSHMNNKPDRKKSAEVTRYVDWWYQTPLMPQDEARDRLGALLLVLFERLSGLGQSVAIATSPHRFNDAAGDENWLAAIVDGNLWENGAYFTSSAKSLRRAPRALHEAMGLLQEVLTSGLRERLGEYFGNAAVAPDTFILSADERGYFIALSASVDNGGPVYKIDQISGLPELIGVAPRLDWRFTKCINNDVNGSYVNSPDNHVIQFVMLEEWIHRLSENQQLSGDDPELYHI